ALPLAAPRPMAQIHVSADGALLALSSSGELWQFGSPWRQLGSGLDPQTPLASGHGRIVGRSIDGGLWLLEGGRQQLSSGLELAPHAGLLVLALGVIAVAGHARQHVVRLEPGSGGRWVETARSRDAVLPDARPLQFDPQGRQSDDNGHVAVLASPDSERYRHAVLGDGVEATSVLYLERHSLSLLARLDLPAPHVLEDIAPRPIAWRGGRALLTMRAGPLGGQLAVITATGERLTLAALGEPIGTRHRWLSATTDGSRLLAVHTPHIGGVLTRYRDDGTRLLGETLGRGVSNHVLGRRELDISAWIGALLVLPSQDRRQLQVWSADVVAGASAAQALTLPAPVAALRRWTRDGQAGVAALLDDGSLAWAAVPG
ncbi:MAG: hypothetical protein Q8N44_10435, partial [Rubrivivax sp.]|nr:hypothetical protein [Rubrivivax sp.]